MTEKRLKFVVPETSHPKFKDRHTSTGFSRMATLTCTSTGRGTWQSKWNACRAPTSS